LQFTASRDRAKHFTARLIHIRSYSRPPNGSLTQLRQGPGCPAASGAPPTNRGSYVGGSAAEPTNGPSSGASRSHAAVVTTVKELDD